MAVRSHPTEGRRSLVKDKKSILHHAGSRRGPSLLDIKSFTEIFRPDGDSQQLKRRKQELVQSYLEQSLPEQEGRHAPPYRKRPRSAIRHATQEPLQRRQHATDGAARAPPPSLTLLHIGVSNDQYFRHERLRPVPLLCKAQLGKHNVEEMEAAYCDVRLMANQLEDQLSRALELRKESGDLEMPVDLVRHILRDNHLGINEAEVGDIIQRMVDRQSVGQSHGEIDFQSILTALRPHVWNDLMTKRIGSHNTAYFLSPRAEVRHGAGSRPSSRGRQGGSQHAEHSEDNATREQAQDEQGGALFVSPRVMDMLPAIPSLRLEQADVDVKGKKDYMNKDLARDTPHCLNQHSKTSLRELKRELAVAEYGVKMLNEKVKQDVVWVNEHCGVRSTKAKKVCNAYGAEKMATILVKLARKAVKYRFVCWKEHHRFCVDQECARQYLRFKACHGMVEVLTTWVHREYRKGFAALLHEMLRQRGVERETAAEVVQKHVRGFTVRRRIKNERETGAAVTIQKLVRGLSVRSKVRERKARLQRQRSAEVIQKHYRHFVRRRRSQQGAQGAGENTLKAKRASANVPTSPKEVQQKSARKPTVADEKKKKAEEEWRARSEEKRKAKEDAKNKALELKAAKEKREADAREQARKRAAMLATASRERKEKEAAEAAARAESTERALATEAIAQTQDDDAADGAVPRRQSLQRVQAGKKKVGHVREKSAMHEPVGGGGDAADKAASRIQRLTRGHSARKKVDNLKAAKGESTAQIPIDEGPDADQQPHTARDPVPTPNSEHLEPEDYDSQPHQEPEPQHEQASKQPPSSAIDAPPPEKPTLNMQVIDSTYTVPIQVSLRSLTAEEARSMPPQKPPTVMDKIAAFFSMLSPGRKRDTEQSPSSASRGLGFLGMRTPQSGLSPSGTKSPALSPSVTRYFCFLSPKAAREDVTHVPVSPSAPAERAVTAMGLESRDVMVKATETGPVREDVKLHPQQPITMRATDRVQLDSPPHLAATPHPPLPPPSASTEEGTVQVGHLIEAEAENVHPQQQRASSPAGIVEGPASLDQRGTLDATATSTLTPRPHSPPATPTDGTPVRPATPSPAEHPDNRPVTPQTATSGQTRPSTATQRTATLQLNETVSVTTTVDELPVTEARVTAGEMGGADILILDDQAGESAGRADEPDVALKGVQIPNTRFRSTSDLTIAQAQGPVQATGAMQIRQPPTSEAPVMRSAPTLRDAAPAAGDSSSVKASDRGLSCLTQENKPVANVEKKEENDDSTLSFSPMAWQPAPTARPAPPQPTKPKAVAPQLPEIPRRPGTAPREDRQQSQTAQCLTAATAMAVGVAGVIHQSAAAPLSSSVSTVAAASIIVASAPIAHLAATPVKRSSTPDLSKPTAQRPSTPPPRPKTPPPTSPSDRPPTAQTRPSSPQPRPPSTPPPRPQSASSRPGSAAPSTPASVPPTEAATHGTEANKPAVQTVTRDQVAGAFKRSFSPAADRHESPRVLVVHHAPAQVPAAEGVVVKHVPTEAVQPVATTQSADIQQQQQQPQQQEASKSFAPSATYAPSPATAPQPHRASSTYARMSIPTRAPISIFQAAEKPTDEIAGLSPEERALKAEQIAMQRKALAAEEAKRKEAERIEAKRLAEEEKKREAAAKREQERLTEQERYRQDLVEEERKRLEHIKAEEEARARQEREEAEKLERRKREQKEAAERARRAEEEKKTQVKLKSMQIRSAVKLQRLFRGHRVRRLIHLRKAAIRELEDKVARIVLRAVVRIQRIARGYMKRRWYVANLAELVTARKERAERRRRVEEERLRREMEEEARPEAAAAAAAAAQADAKAAVKPQEVERRPSVGGRSVEMTEEMLEKLEKLQKLEELEKKLQEREKALQEAERKLQETSSQLRVTPTDTETALVPKKDGGEIVAVAEGEQGIVERNDDRQLGEWLEYWDDEAQSYYYYNPRTEEASWTVPDNTARSLTSTTASDSVVTAEDKASGRWIEQWDDVNQLPYWYNEETGEAGWTNPGEASTEDNALQPYLQHPEEWVSYWDEKTGNEYWYNVRTGEASWQ